MSLKKALLAATVMSLPLAAQAQPVTGLYIAGGVGANWLGNFDSLNLSGLPASISNQVGTGASNSIDFSTGIMGVGSLGWGFGNGIRVELEGSYRYNEVDKARAYSRPTFNIGGDTTQIGALANVLYDFNLSSWGVSPRTFMPYIGAGVGYVWGNANKIGYSVTGNAGNIVRTNIDDSSGAFAYQAIVGGAFGLGDFVPGLALTVEYRFLGTLEQSYSGTVTGANNTSATIGAKPTPYNQSVLLGVRYAFNAPRPPAPVAPAPAPAPARTYLVFFDWDRADLTDRARQIIGEAANNARTSNVTRIEVQGHADRSGDAAYNMRLSQRRADAVAAELVRRGVARTAITTQAFGETRPLVPTADGVREPQNRRVEIIFR
jgi:outer membrane protein OmpA-like peptidoglycan-associated protein